MSYSLCSAAKQMYVVWLKPENCTTLEIPGYSRHSVCRPVKQRGPIRGGICVYVAAHLSLHVKVWRVAADSSYVWLRLSHVKVNGSELYLCV